MFTFDQKELLINYTKLSSLTTNDPEHKKKLTNPHPKDDRYKNVLPYNYNIPKLSNKEYINASFIHLPSYRNIIATQGPKKETFNNFYQMIFDYDINVIVMLCQFIENNRVKCDNYLKINELNLNFQIEMIEKKDIETKSLIVNKLYVLNKITKEKKEIYHINFLFWPDHYVPDIKKTFNDFIQIFYLIYFKKGDKPLLVHCSAGVGRTGTFISIFLLFNEIQTQLKNNNQTIQFNIFNVVRQLKEMRLLLVENNEQYIFIYKFVKYYLEHYKEIF